MTTIDKYKIIKPLGGGHFGDVYLALDRALNTEKAIKILKTSEPDKFLKGLDEAQILKRCEHEHIVKINEANIFQIGTDLKVVLDLEFIKEGSLEQALGQRWVPISESVEHLRKALRGLEHAHSENILHRDIKPGNILLSPRAAKLSDFGLATEVNVGAIGSDQGYITQLPPEFFATPITNVQSDIYATGITLYRSVNNISNWEKIVCVIPNYEDAIMHGKLIQKIDFIDSTPDRIKRIIRRACHADPSKRYATAQEFRQALDRLRYNIDWKKICDFKWIADRPDEYEIYVESTKRSLTVKKNGRRIRNQCQSFDTLEAAVKAMHDFIAKTTLR